MYDYIKGILASKSNTAKGTFATIEAFGIGYLIEITQRDYDKLYENTETKIYTMLIHREDKMSMCGFSKREDRDIFNILTSVSGVGSRMALTLLDEFDSPELIGLVIEENYKELTRAKGVGPKLAQKIILELKDKLVNYKENEPIAITTAKTQSNQSIDDAQAVLLSLGYERDEIKNSMTKAIALLKANATAEEILKNTLQILSDKVF